MKRLLFYMLLIVFIGCGASGYVPSDPSDKLCKARVERLNEKLELVKRSNKIIINKYNEDTKELKDEIFELELEIAKLKIINRELLDKLDGK